MANASEETMVAMLAREQRSFRGILIAGVTILFVMVLASIALSVYFSIAAATLKNTTSDLERHAFDTRRLVQTQSAQIAQQQQQLRLTFLENRANAQDTPLTAAQLAPVRTDAENFLRRGRRIPMNDERSMRRGMSPDEALTNAVDKALYTAVMALSDSARIGEQINRQGALPRRLKTAQDNFQKVLADPAADAPARALANAGLASILFTKAQNSRFAQADCDAVYAAVNASAVDGTPGPQPLYWRANCERKTGATAASLRDYALSLQAVTILDGGDNQGGGNRTEWTLAQNAFHGIGTTLIALDAAAMNDPQLHDAITIARQKCVAPGIQAHDPQMALAETCLQRAIAIRRDQLQQSDADIAGTQENLGFAYLRDNDLQQAFDNAEDVEPDSLSPWNELIRAYASGQLQTPAARTAHLQAMHNVAFFDVNEFNICEIRRLLSPTHYTQIIEMIRTARADVPDGKKAVDDALAACGPAA